MQRAIDRANIDFANKYKVANGISIGIFTFEVSPLYNSRARSYTFRLSISKKTVTA